MRVHISNFNIYICLAKNLMKGLYNRLAVNSDKNQKEFWILTTLKCAKITLDSSSLRYNLKCPIWFKYNFNYVYISSLVLSSYKLIFKSELYPKFI
jgi:hypothetical protein